MKEMRKTDKWLSADRTRCIMILECPYCDRPHYEDFDQHPLPGDTISCRHCHEKVELA
jgi:mRNA-degrading endonuclease YafQ of YafQ-DinJ toxin-antitoxin module